MIVVLFFLALDFLQPLTDDREPEKSGISPPTLYLSYKMHFR